MEQKPTSCADSYTVIQEGRSSEPPWVFLHGALGDANIWHPMSQALLSGGFERKMVLLDLPGHGFSHGPAFDDLDATAAYVVDFLERHDLFPCIPVGHSMGGAIAQLVALSRPEAIESLVLVGSGATLGVAPVIFDKLENDVPKALDLMQAFNFAKETSSKTIRFVMDGMARCGAETGIRDLKGCDAFRTVERLSSLKLAQPPVVFVGNEDKMTPPKKNRRLAESLGASFHEIAGAGHMLHVERPDELVKILATLPMF